MADGKSRVSLNVLSKYRFVQSPFVDIKDKSYRMLLQRYGTSVTYSQTISSTLITEEYYGENCQQPHQPHVNTIFQVKAENIDSLIETASILQDKDAFALDIIHTEDGSWSNILASIKDVTSKVSIPVACKINVNLDDISQLIEMIEQLELAGCKVLLLYGHSHVGTSSILHRKHWETIKKIRNSTCLETILLEVQCSCLKEAEQCLDYTGLQGIAIADPLLWNPAFFFNKRISTIEMIRDYIDLCQVYCTQLSTAKEHIEKFSGYFLKRFSDVKNSIDAATTYEDIMAALETLETEISQLSKNRVKSFEKLQKKKEKHWINKLKRKGLQNETSELGCTTIFKSCCLTSGDCQSQEDRLSKREVKQNQRERVTEALKSGQQVAVDLSLALHMSDKEITKVAGQVRRLYGSNLRAPHPFHLYFTGIDKDGRIHKECQRQNNGFDNYLVDMRRKRIQDLFDSQSVVYLSPDSPNVLNQLDKSNVYVIGGLVDHQVLKGVSLNNADQSHIHTARLPLDEYMEKTSTGNHSYSRVLTINQVFDILLTYHETHDWTQALLAGVPKRKGFQPRISQTTENEQ